VRPEDNQVRGAPIRYLFIHQTIPGQFVHLAGALARDKGNTVVFLTRLGRYEIPNVKTARYRIPRPRRTHPHLQNLQNAVVAGEAVANALLELEKSGFRPDLVYAHPGWGETLFIKEIWPDVPVIHYCEFYYHTLGADSFAEPNEVPTFADHIRTHAKNAVNLLSLEICDRGITPTSWQFRQHPKQYQSKISVIHDGVDTTTVVPNARASFRWRNDVEFKAGEEIITYVNRNLEPFRGLFTFADAAEKVARRRPNCRFLVVGAETGRYYGPHPPKGMTYREMALAKLDHARDRLFFLGMLPRSDFVRVLQISAAHVYLTRPFVLSWSLIEALSAGCLVIGAASPPVAEVVTDEENGLLVDPFSADELAERIVETLENPDKMLPIRAAARQTAVENYSLDVCLPRQQTLIAEVIAASATKRYGIPDTAAAAVSTT
jgi:glycosyltransferase involved in cell wall biosynthesis